MEHDGNQPGEIDPGLIRFLEALDVAIDRPEIAVPRLLLVVDGVVVRGYYVRAEQVRSDPEDIPVAFRFLADRSECEHLLTPPILNLRDVMVISGAAQVNVTGGPFRIRLDRVSAWSTDVPGSS